MALELPMTKAFSQRHSSKVVEKFYNTMEFTSIYERSFKSPKVRCFTSVKYPTKIRN